MATCHAFPETEDQLHDEASRICGLTDFGDSHYLTGLRVMLASTRADSRLTPEGARLAHDALLISLIARAIAEKGWREHPEYRQTVVDRPVIITGVPRTGTTALHKLLAVDPQFQGVEHWLTTAPMPRPARETWEAHPLRARAARFIAGVAEESPTFKSAHHVIVDEYDECIELLRQSFVSNRWASTWTMTSYDLWWQTQSEHIPYQRYADLVRLIGCHEPKRRWLMKNPGHIHHLDLLFGVFPDARIIQTHRHPVQAIGSMASTIHNLHRAFEGEDAEITKPLVGRREMEKWAVGVERSAPVRQRHRQQIFDMQHGDFHRAPLEMVGRIYDFLGLTLSGDVEAKMAARISAKPELAHGEHRYTLGEYGLNAAEVCERYRAYIDETGFA